MSDQFDYSVLSELQPTSKDCKTLIPTLVSLFQQLEFNINQQFTSFRNEFFEKLQEKDTEIKGLRHEIDLLKKTVNKLEDQLDDNDAYERRDVVIFSGSSLPPAQDNENCETVIRESIQEKLKIVIPKDGISVCHRMGSKAKSQKPDNRPIIAKFCQRSTKTDIIIASRKMRIPNFFANESLTPVRQSIAYALRKAKREFPNLICGTSTRDGRVFVWLKSPSVEANPTRKSINNRRELEDFCLRTLNKDMKYFIDDWTH